MEPTHVAEAKQWKTLNLAFVATPSGKVLCWPFNSCERTFQGCFQFKSLLTHLTNTTQLLDGIVKNHNVHLIKNLSAPNWFILLVLLFSYRHPLYTQPIIVNRKGTKALTANNTLVLLITLSSALPKLPLCRGLVLYSFYTVAVSQLVDYDLNVVMGVVGCLNM